MGKKSIGILGATGSIGKQALEVIEEFPDRFSVEFLTAKSSVQLLVEQAKKFSPKYIVVSEEEQLDVLTAAIGDTDIKIMAGEAALCEVASLESVDLLLSAIVGFAGLKPTLAALEKGIDVALANKETLVVAGAMVMDVAKEHGAKIIPVDSEHSAIFQCLQGEAPDTVEKIILTASGGPFLDKKPNFLKNVKKDHALQHPNWDMGAKITIDSATLMNKGLEVIEARWLFGLDPEQIDVIVHPQSIIHSMVQFSDGSIKSQMGLPDMKLPIQYALGYPNRITNNFKRLDFKEYRKLKFKEPDIKTFRNLALALKALEDGGNSACVMNAANAEAVYAFLENKIGFLEMTEIIENTMEEIPFVEDASLDAFVESDREARKCALRLIKEKR
ncbi:MAG TPA: 1-deoxy-D-xylulose-5-phosphate reductoisomerase [Chitinophagaceae bacterium]|nr:1-deoxy-D-xylulose-5-phosphate reductoisomerase [Chitinophagaceae bacterium]